MTEGGSPCGTFYFRNLDRADAEIIFVVAEIADFMSNDFVKHVVRNRSENGRRRMYRVDTDLAVRKKYFLPADALHFYRVSVPFFFSYFSLRFIKIVAMLGNKIFCRFTVAKSLRDY